MSSQELDIALGIMSGELIGVEYWSMEGVRRAHGELNIGL